MKIPNLRHVIAALGLICLMAPLAASADKAGECMRLWQLEKETGCPAMPPDISAYPTPARENFLMNSEFGPTKCVIEENLDKEKKGIKKECEDWLKDRKSDLGASYLTGTCNADCAPCPKNEVLRRCSYKGEVHYNVK